MYDLYNAISVRAAGVMDAAELVQRELSGR